MVVIDEDNLIFEGAEGETITINVVPNNTAYGVTYTLDGVEHNLLEGDQIEFALEKKPGGKATKLRIFFHFPDEGGSGGSYDEVVEGSLGGTLPIVWLQAGQDVAIGRHTFRVS